MKLTCGRSMIEVSLMARLLVAAFMIGAQTPVADPNGNSLKSSTCILNGCPRYGTPPVDSSEDEQDDKTRVNHR